MKKLIFKNVKMLLRVCSVFSLVTIISLLIYAFTINRLNDDFLKQLGIDKAEADKKICNSILGGYIDVYGVRNLKDIAVGNRTALAKDLLLYLKAYTVSEHFKQEYAALKEQHKPEAVKKPETPTELRANMIQQAKEFVKTAEDNLNKATPDLKPIFEEGVKAAKQNLKDAEDPENKYIKAYTKNFDVLQQSIEQSNQAQLKDWEAKYPSNPLLFVKVRLEQFLTETNDIDFNAAVIDKNGKKIFVNPAYEKKGNRWKMAFRAGKEVVEPARAFAQQWMAEIK
ncbi:MAG TPA: hypothetical protein VFV68_03330 [Agriterribacter sp.]|nr:hypothetical protein [Agriterribacter sp.]